ncbi:tetratricopeptide repeat protein [Methylobacter sp. S3L5C]|uniref:tetratricopeptide repeat protein n=1 Tax=Methylobacter sp. S3L5C TaxID=2839024 RepID=UPI001FAC7498|nr:tetratricopeptide repeat protein [Methylobacter sp. S3L5C]UOA09338.1 tetratricopeptide repeat protein [Methylobacter sp. S3L5C]
MLIFRLLSVITFVFLNSCTDSSVKPSAAEKSVAPVKTAQAKEKTQQKELKTSIDPDVLFTLLTAEIAGQRGQYDIALEGYMEAAKRTHEPKFAERAAMIAMYMKNSNKTNEAVALWLHQDPQSQAARKIAALLALRAGNKKVATEQLNALLVADPAGFENALLELASVLQKEGRINAVYDSLDALSLLHPDQAVIYFMQSLFAMQRKDINSAEMKIQQALKIQPGWDKALIFQAQIAVFSGDLSKAKSLLKDASLKYPANNKINKTLAQVLIKSENYEEAIEVYKKIISTEPNDLESQFAMGLIYLQLNQDDQAEDIFKKLLELPEWQYQSMFYLGKIEEKHGHMKKALVWFDKVADGPFVFDASISAIALLEKDKQLNEASLRLTLLQAKFPKQKLRLLLVQAELFNQQKQYEKAFNLLTKALAEFPDQKELLYTRALMAERVNKPDVVEADLKKILATDPDNVEALNALGYTLLSKSSRYGEAEKYLQHALKLAPNEAVVIDSYGWLQFKLGNNEKALGYLQQAYDKQQEHEITAHLAEVLWALDRKDEAKKLFNKAIKDAPDDEYLLDFQQRILNGKR